MSKPSTFQWRTPEQAIVRAHYPLGGWKACIELLPGRTRGSIQQQAAKLKVRSAKEERRGKPRQRHTSSEFIDAAIRRLYESRPDRDAVRDAVKRLNRPRWWLSKRATLLGLVVPWLKDPVWTDEEYELLDVHSHKSPTVISRIFAQQGYKRTATAIQLARKRQSLGVTACRQASGRYSANQVAGLMGVDSKTVTRWINRKMLEAKRRGTARVQSQGGDEFEVTTVALRKFIVTFPEHVDLRKVERFWFIQLMGRRAA